MDANEAVARAAYALNEVVSIYPITPASPMGEWADAWAQQGRPNLWGTVPTVAELQSEAGAAGTVHGALTTGALATTFTASQGLLLMLPNMFKIAGELTPAVFHVAARAVATHALSIFGDHSDVMAARSTGFALLASGSVQEAQDMAAIAQTASLAGRLPVLHFFDGFRTSHELQRIAVLDDDQLRALVDEELLLAHRGRALSPDRPSVRGTAQNPDVFFQSREAAAPFYRAFPDRVAEAMQHFAAITGRTYRPFDYEGAPDAERVLVIMGSGAEVAHEAVDHLLARGEKVGVLKVRLFRPFDVARFVAALPDTVRGITVLDRTKEPGAVGEPLYQEVVAALAEAGRQVPTLGGRFGLSSKEFTPAMAKAALDELAAPEPRRHFTVGIVDDVSQSHLAVDDAFRTDDAPDVTRAVFYGLGSDGTIGANKSTCGILAERTDLHVQGYFVYDSKKAGAVTVSHLRFGPRPIRSSYLVQPGSAAFVAVHHPRLLERPDVLQLAAEGATLLLNVPWPAAEAWARLPRALQDTIRTKRIAVHVVDAGALARAHGLGRRINTIMQVAFFELTGLLPEADALAAIRASVEKSYGKGGPAIVEKNLRAVEAARSAVVRLEIPAASNGSAPPPIDRFADAPAFAREVTAAMVAGRGDELPVSALPVDGVFPSGTARFEKRAIAEEIPVWEPDLCIQCAKCTIACPHAAIRLKVYEPEKLEGAPTDFLAADFRGTDHPGQKLTIQVAPEDCTGCEICVHVCPAKDKAEPKRKALNLAAAGDRLPADRDNFDFFLGLPELDRRNVKLDQVRDCQVLEPLFEFSGACAGCGETPYVKLLSQLFGDRLLVANATGCSSIYGGNLPTTPWTSNRDGRGPAWSNSLFEDAAEFGYGYRLSLDTQRGEADLLLEELRGEIGDDLVDGLRAPCRDEAEIHDQRERVATLQAKLGSLDTDQARRLASLADHLVPKSVWVVGGDGWAYDIGFAGLDHVLSSGRNVNILVLDTEVYSNTGGQASKATPRAAVAKFAAAGKATSKKDIGMIAMAHTHAYVAQVALGASDKQTVRAFVEAERFDGPSIILAYSHCIAHGIPMAHGMEHQKLAVDSGHWPLYRYDPQRMRDGNNPLQLDSRAPTIPFRRFAERETRFHALTRSRPAEAKRLQALAQQDIAERWHLLEQMAGLHYEVEEL